MAIWADYSDGRPGGAALRKAGFTGAIRYVGLGSAGKRITAAEYRDLVANGLDVLLVAEYGNYDPINGYRAGLANARSALADARALGIPDSVGVASAADGHLNAGQVRTGVGYHAGFAEVLGTERAGAYGFGEYIRAIQAAGSASWLWQCGTRPAPGVGVHFWQRNVGLTQVEVNGVTVDIDDQLLPLPITGDDDMMPIAGEWPPGPDQHHVLTFPVGSASELVGNAWFSIAVPFSPARVISIWFIASSRGGGKYVRTIGEFELAPDSRAWWEIPDGVDQITVAYQSNSPIAWCLEAQRK